MSILIYKNNRDSSALFGSFLIDVNDQISENVREHVDFHEAFRYGPAMAMVENHDTSIIVSHGSPDTIYFNWDDNIPLVSTKNVHKFNNKKVVAICCSTAQDLGPAAEEYCKVYLGFNHKIHMDRYQQDHTSEAFRKTAVAIYQDVFKRCLVEAINHSVNFKSLSIKISDELRKKLNIVVNTIRRSGNPNLTEEEILDLRKAVNHVASNIKIYGNNQELIS